MKKTTLKFSAILIFAFLGLMGCLSSEGQADSSSEAKAQNSNQQHPAPAVASKSSKNDNSKFIEGKHYIELFPEMNTSVAEGKIELVELFWLGCPHCYSLESTIAKLKSSLPDDVEFKQIPAVLNPRWAFHAKAVFTAQILDPDNKQHLVEKLFKEYHENHKRLNKPDLVKAFFVEQGFTETQFNNTFNSIALSAAMSNAETVSADSQADAVPTMIINGKYRTSVAMAEGEENLLKIIDMLIKKERK
jgi:thiol:disulfide interchange protein DsbA